MSEEKRAAARHRYRKKREPTERPATFREVFSSREFRALYAATLLSWVGDYIAKAAVAALVYQKTSSVAVSAATFAIGYVPWVLGGPVLAALAERNPFRRVMVICDVFRAGLVALVAIPGMPVPAMLVLLFTTALLNPPFEAARSALTPRLVEGDRYAQALVLQNITSQAAQLAGYVTGASLAAFHPHAALLLDATTFVLSGLLVRLRIRAYQPAAVRAQRTHLLRETGQGFRMVFGSDVLRAIAVLIFALMLFTTVPEGLAAAWAGHLSHGDPTGAGLDQGLIMAGYPAGFILGGLLVTRLLPPQDRRRLIRPLAVLVPLAVVPALLDPPAVVIMVMTAVCGFAAAGLFPTANSLFVQALPDAFRARAFGIMQSGVLVLQGVAIFSCGALADHFALPTVVGLWSLAGVLVMGVASAQWPTRHRFRRAFEAAAAVN
ncbi:MAG TPA: MFS transporter, partial [Rugosimonospora sp.]|nr:MFS transporter [Rugosimonospora sp.]